MSTQNVKFTDLLDCPKVLVANDVIVVNADASGLTEVSPASLISGIGSGFANDIVTFTAGNPPLQDSGMAIIQPSVPENYIDFDPSNSQSMIIGKNNSDLKISNSEGQLSIQSSTAFMQETFNGSTVLVDVTGVHLTSVASNIDANGVIIDPSQNMSGLLSVALKNGLNVITFSSNAGASYPLVWPVAQGVAGSVLTNDGAGNLSWVAPGP